MISLSLPILSRILENGTNGQAQTLINSISLFQRPTGDLGLRIDRPNSELTRPLYHGCQDVKNLTLQSFGSYKDNLIR